MQKKLNIIFGSVILALVLVVAFLGVIVFTPAEEPQVRSFVTKIHFDDGGDKMTVENGGVIDLKSGATLALQSGVSFTLTELSTSNVLADYITATVSLSAERIEASDIIAGYVEAGELRTSTTATFDDGANVTGTLKVNTINPVSGNSIIVSAGTTTGTVYARDNMAVGTGMPSTLDGGDGWFAGSVDATGAITTAGTMNIPAGCTTPGLRFSTDTDTGICSSGGNTIDFWTGGQRRAQVGEGGIWDVYGMTIDGSLRISSRSVVLTTPGQTISVSGVGSSYILTATVAQTVTIAAPYADGEYLSLIAGPASQNITVNDANVKKPGGGLVLGAWDAARLESSNGWWVVVGTSNNQP